MQRAARALARSVALAMVVAACSAQPATSDGPVTGAPPTPVGGEPVATGVTITALNIEFTPQGVSVPSGQPFSVELLNRDEGVPHDIEVLDPNGAVLVKSEIATGPARLIVQVPALAPGTYSFRCAVHPNMTGTITAE